MNKHPKLAAAPEDTLSREVENAGGRLLVPPAELDRKVLEHAGLALRRRRETVLKPPALRFPLIPWLAAAAAMAVIALAWWSTSSPRPPAVPEQMAAQEAAADPLDELAAEIDLFLTGLDFASAPGVANAGGATNGNGEDTFDQKLELLEAEIYMELQEQLN